MKARGVWALGALLVACHGSSGTDGGVLVSTTAATSGSTASHAQPSPHATGSAGPSKAPLCRAITVTGPMHRVGTLALPDGGAIASGELAGEDWIDLGPTSRLSIKNGTTGRESNFEGAASVKVCVGGEEEMWLPSGGFSSVAGAGEAPGAEQWIVTPHGIVRYDAARVHVVAGVAATEVTLGSGSATLFPIDNAYRRGADAGAGREGVPLSKSENGWISAPPGQMVALVARRSTSQVVTECEEVAKVASDLGAAIASQDASLAEAAPKHVLARQKARAVCAVAGLLASRALDPVERERMVPRVRAASALWHGGSAP